MNITDNKKNRKWELYQKITIFDSFTFEKTKEIKNKGSMGNISIVTLNGSNELFVSKSPTPLDISEFDYDKNKEAINKETKILLTIPPHPHIIECFLVERIFGIPHIFMEYIDGGDLEQWIVNNSNVKEWSMYINIIKQIARGILHAHMNGLIHGDLKPLNILVSTQYVVNDIPLIKVTDFGLSKIFKIENVTNNKLSKSISETIYSEDYDYTSSDYTPLYASPEQEIWKGINIGKEADVFSFGIILIELITSKLQFKDQIQYYEIFPETQAQGKEFYKKIEIYVKEKRNDIPDRLLMIILKCLQIHPGKRYSSFEEILKELDQIVIPNTSNIDFRLVNIDQGSKILLYSLRGYSLSRLGYNTEAKIQLKNVVQIDPLQDIDFINKGIALSDLGQYEEAINCYDKILESQQQRNEFLLIGALLNKGYALDNLQKFDESKKCFEQVLLIDNKNVLAYNNKGLAFYKMKKYKEAIDCYDEVLKQAPEYVPSLFNKGLAFSSINRHNEALNSFNQVLELDPSYTEAYLAKGICLYELKSYPQSIVEFDRVLKINPQNIEAIRYKTYSVYQLKKNEDVLNLCNELLTINQNDIHILDLKGRTLSNLGRYDEEINCYDKKLEIDPKNITALIRKSYVYETYLGKPEQNIECCDKILEIDPKNIEALNNKGLAYIHLRRFKEAITNLDIALNINPNYILALNSKGIVFLESRDYTEALKWFNKALQLNQDLMSAIRAKAQIYDKLGNYEEALLYYNKILEKDTTDLRVLNYKGIVLGKLGKYDDAIDCFNTILEFDPNSIGAQKNKEYANYLKSRKYH